MSFENSKDLAYRVRRHALDMTSRGGTAHIGSIFSMADIVAVLYADVLHHNPKDPAMPDRDRLILRLLSRKRVGAALPERQPPERAREP